MVHGRFSDFGLPVNWITADILRIKDSILVERWDVIQDEASPEQSIGFACLEVVLDRGERLDWFEAISSSASS